MIAVVGSTVVPTYEACAVNAQRKRAAEFISAVRTAGDKPGGSSATCQRAAEFISAVRTAGINPAARRNDALLAQSSVFRKGVSKWQLFLHSSRCGNGIRVSHPLPHHHLGDGSEAVS